MRLGELIKRHRRQSGYTQRQLATLVDVHHTTISHLEADRITVSNKLIEQIVQQICNAEYTSEDLCIIGGIFDVDAVIKLANSDPIICRLLRHLPTLPEHKIVAICEVILAEETDDD